MGNSCGAAYCCTDKQPDIMQSSVEKQSETDSVYHKSSNKQSNQNIIPYNQVDNS